MPRNRKEGTDIKNLMHDLPGGQTHDLEHLEQTCLSLRHLHIFPFQYTCC